MIDLVEKALDAILPAEDAGPGQLSRSMRWAVMGGGKRIRPRICLLSACAAGGQAEDAVWSACAIEFLHSYTLVHDDLPAMDNDTERRGRASVWAKFGEAAAILAGDALQALAFTAAARSPRNATAIVAVLGRAATAVVEGQVADLAGIKDPEGVFERKTAALFAAAAEMGALSAEAPEPVAMRLRAYGREQGLAFQYQDDLLDAADGDFSSISVLGRDEVARRVASHTECALAALDGIPGDATPLADIAVDLGRRTF